LAQEKKEQPSFYHVKHGHGGTEVILVATVYAPAVHNIDNIPAHFIDEAPVWGVIALASDQYSKDIRLIYK
jgi:hypothetical protein